MNAAPDVYELPTFSPAVLRLLRQLDDERATARAIADALEADPGLAGNLLRLANSARYRPSTAIGTIPAAVARVGIDVVATLAATRWLANATPSTIRDQGDTAATFWAHAVAAGVIGERLGASVGVPASEAYIGALLHDIGRLALACDARRRRARGEPVAAPDPHDHAIAGHALAVRWALPGALCVAIRWHHDPDEADPALQVHADLAHAASVLARSIGYGAPSPAGKAVLPGPIARLGRTAADLADEVVGCATRIEATIASLFGRREPRSAA